MPDRVQQERMRVVSELVGGLLMVVCGGAIVTLTALVVLSYVGGWDAPSFWWWMLLVVVPALGTALLADHVDTLTTVTPLDTRPLRDEARHWEGEHRGEGDMPQSRELWRRLAEYWDHNG